MGALPKPFKGFGFFGHESGRRRLRLRLRLRLRMRLRLRRRLRRRFNLEKIGRTKTNLLGNPFEWHVEG